MNKILVECILCTNKDIGNIFSGPYRNKIEQTGRYIFRARSAEMTDLLYFLFYSRPIKIEDFAEHYRTMSADSDFRFSEEFEELKHVGRDQPCTAADLPCNRPKNRFTNILPYDHSRFKLQPVDDEEGSDYINANYVPVRFNAYIFSNPILNTLSAAKFCQISFQVGPEVLPRLMKI